MNAAYNCILTLSAVFLGHFPVQGIAACQIRSPISTRLLRVSLARTKTTRHSGNKAYCISSVTTAIAKPDQRTLGNDEIVTVKCKHVTRRLTTLDTHMLIVLLRRQQHSSPHSYSPSSKWWRMSAVDSNGLQRAATDENLPSAAAAHHSRELWVACADAYLMLLLLLLETMLNSAQLWSFDPTDFRLFWCPHPQLSNTAFIIKVCSLSCSRGKWIP